MNNELKSRIRKNFNNSLNTYDSSCFIQDMISSECIKKLLEYNHTFDTVGDFACGTGQSTSILLNNIKYSKCFAIDFSEKLLAFAKAKLDKNNIAFILSDIDESIFKNSFFDLIFCNMGLQWCPNLSHTLKLLNYYTKRNGLLLFSIPSKNNFPELKNYYKNSMYTHENIVYKLLVSRFKIKYYNTLSYTKIFKNTYEAIKSIKLTGANSLSNNVQSPAGLSKSYCNNFFHNPIKPSLTYNIKIYVAQK